MQIDQKTVAAFQAGETEAFRKIYEITKQPVFAVIYRMINNQHDAEDIMHDVYIRIFEKRKQYRTEKAGLYTWIYQVAINQTLNVLKRKKRITELPQTELATTNDLHNDDREFALQLMEKINPDFKTCLILREIEEKSYEEIAKLLHISIGTVRSRINRGRAELKKALQKHNGR